VFAGAKEQITHRLRERGYKGSSQAKDAYMAGSYAARVTSLVSAPEFKS
jgi:hypothetical protein